MKYDLNLAPQHYRTRRWIAMALYSLSAVVMVLLFQKKLAVEARQLETDTLQMRVQNIQAEQAQLKQKRQALNHGETTPSAQELQDDIIFSNGLITQKSFYWTQFLSDLEQKVPQQVAIRQVKPSFSKGRVKIKGSAQSLKRLTQLMTQLESAPQFADVLLLDQKPDLKSAVKNAIRFTLTFVYLGDERESG